MVVGICFLRIRPELACARSQAWLMIRATHHGLTVDNLAKPRAAHLDGLALSLISTMLFARTKRLAKMRDRGHSKIGKAKQCLVRRFAHFSDSLQASREQRVLYPGWEPNFTGWCLIRKLWRWLKLAHFFTFGPDLDWRPLPLDDNLSAFFERRLHYRFQIGITQELVSQVELSIELPFGTWQWLWQIPFFGHVHYAVGSAASVHPLNVPPEPGHRFYFPFFSPISTRRRRMASRAIPSSDELAAVSCQHIENRDVYYVNGPKFQRKQIAD
jgi:hypothetical protein